MTRHQHLAAFIGCMAVTFALYARTFGFDWTYDDFMVIVDNPDVRSWGNFIADSYPGRPLRELTYLFDHSLFGMEPAGWRIQQLFWHGLCGFLLFQVAVMVTRQYWCGLFAALLFLVHPLQVEVVANLSHRKDSLVLVFCLLALLAWSRSFGAARPAWWRLGALLAWGVALLAKENAIVLPLLALLYEWQLQPPDRRFLLRLPRAELVYPAAIAVAGAAWCWAQGGAAAYRAWSALLLGKMEYFGELASGGYPRTMFKAWAFMVLRLVWPADLAVEYLFPAPSSWGDPWVIGGLVFAAALMALCAWGIATRRPQAAFWGGWLIVFWLPTSNLWPMVYFAADRYLYPFVAGAAVLLAWWGRHLLRRDDVYVVVALIICLPLAALSWHQSGFWKNDDILHRHALEISPQSSFLNNELGKFAEKRGDAAAAMDYYRAALERNPHNAAAHFNLGQIYERSGFLSRALEHYQEFLRDDSPAYQEAARELIERLRHQHGLIFKGRS
jgi:tetratricopeptide (TPR) repeat protein